MQKGKDSVWRAGTLASDAFIEMEKALAGGSTSPTCLFQCIYDGDCKSLRIVEEIAGKDDSADGCKDVCIFCDQVMDCDACVHNGNAAICERCTNF